jgi:hypothetical protein
MWVNLVCVRGLLRLRQPPQVALDGNVAEFTRGRQYKRRGFCRSNSTLIVAKSWIEWEHRRRKVISKVGMNAARIMAPSTHGRPVRDGAIRPVAALAASDATSKVQRWNGPSADKRKTLLLKMWIEREGLGHPPLAHYNERYGVHQAQPSLPSLKQHVEPGIVKLFIDPHHIHERREICAEASDSINTQASAN